MHAKSDLESWGMGRGCLRIHNSVLMHACMHAISITYCSSASRYVSNAWLRHTKINVAETDWLLRHGQIPPFKWCTMTIFNCKILCFLFMSSHREIPPSTMGKIMINEQWTITGQRRAKKCMAQPENARWRFSETVSRKHKHLCI